MIPDFAHIRVDHRAIEAQTIVCSLCNRSGLVILNFDKILDGPYQSAITSAHPCDIVPGNFDDLSPIPSRD